MPTQWSVYGATRSGGNQLVYADPVGGEVNAGDRYPSGLLHDLQPMHDPQAGSDWRSVRDPSTSPGGSTLRLKIMSSKPRQVARIREFFGRWREAMRIIRISNAVLTSPDRVLRGASRNHLESGQVDVRRRRPCPQAPDSRDSFLSAREKIPNQRSFLRMNKEV